MLSKIGSLDDLRNRHKSNTGSLSNFNLSILKQLRDGGQDDIQDDLVARLVSRLCNKRRQ